MTASELTSNDVSAAEKDKNVKVHPANTLSASSSASSASAAATRSIFLFLGLMFRRPSKLFRPSRGNCCVRAKLMPVDTWGGLRLLAAQSDQTLSPAFIRTLMKSKSGAIAMFLTIAPPLLVNTALGFLLFTSHSFLALSLARLDSFKHHDATDTQALEEKINIHTLLSGPIIVPAHPTVLSALAGAGAGMIQGMAFTPVENVVRLLQQSATSVTSLFVRVLRLPLPNIPTAEPIPTSPVEAVKNFLSSDRWVKSPHWWAGWRWTVARDALSYSVFFAAFDMTRRAGLRVKALFGGPIQTDYNNVIAYVPSKSAEGTPTIARFAQATTIVAGGVAASLGAEIAGRPFRACQKIIQNNTTGSARPILDVYRNHGFKPFVSSGFAAPIDTSHNKIRRLVTRVGWRMAAVGPWGFGFLVWAWVGGEV